MQPINLSKLMSEVRRFESSDTCKQAAKIYFLRNYTIEMIDPFLKYDLYVESIKPEVFFGEYNIINQELINHSSALYQVNPEMVVLSLMLDPFMSKGSEAIDRTAEDIFKELEVMYSQIVNNTQALLLINTFIPPFYSEMGIVYSDLISRLDELVLKINYSIREYVKKNPTRIYLADWERMLRILGEDASIDYRYWYSSKAPFKNSFLSLYAGEIAKVVKALKGKGKKCVVLDGDNTLWGGIVGEDGLDGIKLDKHNYPGNIFYEFQKNLLHLYKRGVLITICSKNNEDDVWEVLDKHPYALLKRSHLAAWRINWENKVDNIRDLARELNIGLDSMVFVDDSDFECGLIRQFIPELSVLQVPDKLYLYPPLLLKDGLFDTLTISNEDIVRTSLYQTEKRRQDEKRQYDNLEEYLASLNLRERIHTIGNAEIARVAQLTQKTNQFNLTTKRYSELDIKGFMDDPGAEIYVLYVDDKYGDYGLTGVMIVRLNEGVVDIDSLLLSCRILGKRLEQVFVSYCMNDIARKWPVYKWQAEYIPTVKNSQVSCFWDDMGFYVVNTIDSVNYYELEAEQFNLKQIDFVEIMGE